MKTRLVVVLTVFLAIAVVPVLASEEEVFETYTAGLVGKCSDVGIPVKLINTTPDDYKCEGWYLYMVGRKIQRKPFRVEVVWFKARVEIPSGRGEMLMVYDENGSPLMVSRELHCWFQNSDGRKSQTRVISIKKYNSEIDIRFGEKLKKTNHFDGSRGTQY